jgi:hypothetical protein
MSLPKVPRLGRNFLTITNVLLVGHQNSDLRKFQKGVRLERLMSRSHGLVNKYIPKDCGKSNFENYQETGKYALMHL